MSDRSSKDAYGALQRHAETLRNQREPDIDELLGIVNESIEPYKVCRTRIEAVEKALQRLIAHWVYGGVLAGLLLLVLSPLLIADWSTPLAATFLLLPAYMIHQYEEHDHDRFRHFFNETIGKGFDVLSPLAVFVTNVPGVWGVIALSLYGAAADNLGWSLVAVYLVLVNAVVHIVHAVIFRRYNPGLFTAVVVFLPLGAFTLIAVNRGGAGSMSGHALGLAAAVAIHAAILLHVRRKLVVLQRTRSGRPA